MFDLDFQAISFDSPSWNFPIRQSFDQPGKFEIQKKKQEY